jgi:hypothetical protein
MLTKLASRPEDVYAMHSADEEMAREHFYVSEKNVHGVSVLCLWRTKSN